MRKILATAALGVALAGPAGAQNTPINIKIGVLSDMTGVLSDAYGPGSALAAQLAHASTYPAA